MLQQIFQDIFGNNSSFQIGDAGIIFGGLTLAVIGLIWLNWKSNKQYFNHTNDVISRNTDAWFKMAETHQRLADVIDRNTVIVEKYHERKSR